MKVTLLGTGSSQGVPEVGCSHSVCLSTDSRDRRTRSSVMIDCRGHTIIIDCGADFRMQMIRSKVFSIDAILFTHEHADHTAGLDDIRPFCYQQKVPVYAQERVMSRLKKRFDYIFNDSKSRYIGAPRIQPNIINDTPFEIKHLKIIPIKVQHGTLDIFGYKIGNFAYITDAKSLTFQEENKIKNIDVLVVNALRIESHPTHFNLSDAISFSKRVNAKQTYFTHISHLLGFHEEVSRQLPESVLLGYDGLEITL